MGSHGCTWAKLKTQRQLYMGGTPVEEDSRPRCISPAKRPLMDVQALIFLTRLVLIGYLMLLKRGETARLTAELCL